MMPPPAYFLADLQYARLFAERTLREIRPGLAARITVAPHGLMTRGGGSPLSEICLGMTPMDPLPVPKAAWSIIAPWDEWRERRRELVDELVQRVESSLSGE